MMVRAVTWGVVAAALALLLARASAVPLIDPDESRFARTSVEMLRSQDLVVPHFGGQPRLVKPPLLHWIQAAAFRVFGITEWVARLPAVLATLGSIALVGWIARRRFGEEAGVWAASCLATMPLVLVMGKIGTLDALLAVHVLAVLALDRGGPRESRPFLPVAMGALLGLAFLIKGPVGVVLPLLLILAGRTATGENVLPSPSAALEGLAAWCAVVLPWGLAFMRRIGLGGTVELVQREVLERFFAGTIHVEPPWFYVQVVALGFLPWIGPLGVGLVRVWRMRKDPSARTALYAAAGLLAGLVFLTLGRDKLPNYILPLAPLAVLVVTWELGQELKEPLRRTTGPALLAATLGVSAFLLGLTAARLEGAARVAALAGVATFLPASLAAGYGVIRRRPRWSYGVAASSMGVFLFAAVLVLYPSIGERRSAGGLVREVPALSGDRPVATVDRKVPSLMFYLDRPIEDLEMAGLTERLAKPDDPLLVFDAHDLGAIPDGAREQLREIARRGRYIVFEKVRAAPAPLQPAPAPTDPARHELPRSRARAAPAGLA